MILQLVTTIFALLSGTPEVTRTTIQKVICKAEFTKFVDAFYLKVVESFGGKELSYTA